MPHDPGPLSATLGFLSAFPRPTESAAQFVEDRVLRILNDVIAELFKSDTTRFLNSHLDSVDGTKQRRFSIHFDSAAFDTEVCAALRTRESDLMIAFGHDSSSVGRFATPTMTEGGGAGNGSAAGSVR